jgi:hypothetical protein
MTNSYEISLGEMFLKRSLFGDYYSACKYGMCLTLEAVYGVSLQKIYDDWAILEAEQKIVDKKARKLTHQLENEIRRKKNLEV